MNEEREGKLKGILRKVLGIGRTSVLTVGLPVTLALTFAVATTASAANGGNFILGSLKNSATTVTKLKGDVANPSLHIYNPSTLTGATAAFFQVAAGQAPFKVSNNVKVALLNSDLLDGLDSTAFLSSTGKAADADKLDGKDSTEFATGTGGKASDADKLDGLDSTALGTKTEHNFSASSDCDTPNTYNQCGKVEVKVPAGKQYQVSVWSTMSWRGANTEQTIYYCSAQDSSCITPFGPQNSVTVPANKIVSASSEGETLTLTEGTYTFNTRVYTEAQVAYDYYTQVITKVMVRDASTPQPTGVSIPPPS